MKLLKRLFTKKKDCNPLKEKVNYYLYGSHIRRSDWPKEQWFNWRSNIYDKRHWGDISRCKVTEAEFTTRFKNKMGCACAVGNGFDIKTAHMYTVDELNRLLPYEGEFYIYTYDSDTKYNWLHYREDDISFEMGLEVFNGKVQIYKQACLRCETCLDELHKVSEIFDTKMKEWLENKRIADKVNEICRVN